MSTFQRSWQASLGGAMLYAFLSPPAAVAHDEPAVSDANDKTEVAQREERESDEAARDKERRGDDLKARAAMIKTAHAQLEEARVRLQANAEVLRKAA
jgi:hypothetical protein